ncbi:ABC transporter permease [Demequina sp.]|uniref:ABC transporter permease n=1 Tax=Demequina sp. TaxID=2050685 RepID=UPI003A87B732
MALSFLKDLIRSIGVILLVTFSTFALMYGNAEGIARSVLGKQATEEAVQQKVIDMGLDRSLVVQYWDWLTSALTGDLGNSFYTSEPVSSALATRVPITLTFVLLTLLLAGLIAVVLGVTAAVRGGVTDKLVQFFSVLGTAIPPYIVAIVLVSLFAVQLRIFPATGYVPPGEDFGLWLQSVTLPVMALLFGAVAGIAAQFRTATLDTLGKDYVRTARARGISEREVLFRNVLRNAAAPGLTALSLTMIGLLGGSVFIEQVFAVPGMGQLANEAAKISDIPMVMGTVLVTILIVLIVNFLGDLAVAMLNPKARKR